MSGKDSHTPMTGDAAARIQRAEARGGEGEGAGKVERGGFAARAQAAAARNEGGAGKGAGSGAGKGASSGAGKGSSGKK